MSATVYRMYDAEDALLYVGISVSWPSRVYQHDTKPWFRDVARVTLEHFNDHHTALAAEGRAQVDENPVYNVVRNGRVPAAREHRQKRLEAQARHDAALVARGVYEMWHHCQNCRNVERVEVPRGVLRGQTPCPRCGVRPADLMPVEDAAA